MGNNRLPRLVSLVAVAFSAFYLWPRAQAASDAPLPAWPSIAIWVWETETDLTKLARKDIGIAFLAATIESTAERLKTRYRLASLRLPSARPPLMPVLRIQSPPASYVARGEELKRKVRAAASKILSDYPYQRIQLDFDARTSERALYQEILADLRVSVCPRGSCFLSVTALYSWCLPGDFWTDMLPVDQVVPMAFSAGTWKPESHTINTLASAPHPCNRAVGILAEAPFPLGDPRSVYVFSKRAWTIEGVNQLPAIR